MENIPFTEKTEIELTILMPCLNEGLSIGRCIEKAQNYLKKASISGEVLVADNGSQDDSVKIAESLGARVVTIREKGYGAALMGGIREARGKYFIMGDADDSYNFLELDVFIEKLRQGNDLVMGNRFRGGIEKGAMKPLHRYLGNPVLSAIGKLFFGGSCSDFHCGLRGANREFILKLDLRTTGMEFASEMIVKACLSKAKIAEVPTTLSCDGRQGRASHLRSWHDGWRHLRFLLMYSPRWLFLIPGIIIMTGGFLGGLWLWVDNRKVGSVYLSIQSLLLCCTLFIIGFQAVCFSVFSKIFAINEGLLPGDPRLDKLFCYVNLERGLLSGALLIGIGFALGVDSILVWKRNYFGEMDPQYSLRLVAPAITFLIVGFQAIFASFFLSILGLKHR